ncbi:MAG TPA: transcription antitermination factor NusB [Coriobacteriia bacterium]
MSVAPARRAALAVLKRVRERTAFGPETLDAVLRASGLDARDTALATRLAYGALQTMGTLDEAIDRVCDRPNALEDGIRDVLRLAAYELLYMRTPARAAVHEGVDAARSVRSAAAGLANAILRKIAAEAETFPWGDPLTDDEALARATGHPLWLVRAWIEELGRERATAALYADLEPAPLYVWSNPFLASIVETTDALVADGAQPSSGPLPACLVAGDAHAAVRGAAIGRGIAVVTDAAAQVAPLACAAPGGVVVDVAAGRGTKTAQVQAACVQAGGAAQVYALDIYEFKARVLTRRMADLGVPGVTALVGDATDLSSVEGLPEPGTAEVVLLDAPCSGLGSLRRRPEKRWRVTEEDIVRLAELQLAMLRECARLVSVKGRVVYSTCTITRAENRGVVEAFLSAEAGRFRVGALPAVIVERWGSAIAEEGWFQSVPESGGPDGHFVVVLERVR